MYALPARAFSREISTLFFSICIHFLLLQVCVHTTVREANDRGYSCVVVDEACASFFQHFHDVGLAMIAAQGGIFGRVASLADVIKGLSGLSSTRPDEEDPDHT